MIQLLKIRKPLPLRVIGSLYNSYSKPGYNLKTIVEEDGVTLICMDSKTIPLFEIKKLNRQPGIRASSDFDALRYGDYYTLLVHIGLALHGRTLAYRESKVYFYPKTLEYEMHFNNNPNYKRLIREARDFFKIASKFYDTMQKIPDNKIAGQLEYLLSTLFADLNLDDDVKKLYMA